MLRYLAYRESGFHRPQVLTQAEQARRTYALSLSPNKEMFSIHKGAVNWLDIEHIDGRYLLSAGADASISLFDLDEPVETRKMEFKPLFHITKGENHGHEFSVSSIQWYPIDTGLFFTGSFDGTVKVWDTNSTTAVQSFDLEGHVYSIALSPIAVNHTLIAVGSADQKCRLCDVRTGTSTHTLIGHRDAVSVVTWSPVNDYLVVTGSKDRTIRFWDVRKAGCLMNLDQHDTPEKSSTNNKHKITINKASTASAHIDAVTGLRFTPDGRFLLSSGADERLRCWSTSTGINTLVNYPATKSIIKSGTMQLSVSSNCSLVYLPTGNSVNVYNIHTGDLHATLQGHYDRVNCCIFHPTKEELYTGGKDHRIHVWTPMFDEMDTDQPVEEETDNWSDEEGK